MRFKIEIFKLLFLFLPHWTIAQQPQLNESICRAVNNFMLFSNEAMHSADIMYGDFERWNWNLNEFISKRADSLPVFFESNILTNYDYYSVLPRELYDNISKSKIFISYDKRDKAIELVGQMHGIIYELDTLRYQLFQYGSQEVFRSDPQLKQAYSLLSRAEILYYDLFVLQEKLHNNLKIIMRDYRYSPKDSSQSEIINKMEKVLQQAQIAIRYSRNGQNPPELQTAIQETSRLLDDLGNNKKRYLANIPPLDSSAYCSHKRYAAFVNRGYEWIEKTQAYRANSNPNYNNLPRPAYYYYYNADILGKYNRYGDGLVSIFNRYIAQSGELRLLQMELPKIYKLVQEKAPQDTITKIDTGLSLQGFAANHLVFLLDASYSMKHPHKMPVLQNALHSLLQLMRPEDNITIITYSSKAELRLPPTSAANKQQVLSVIDTLPMTGGSNAKDGLKMAYEMGFNHFISGGNNRIIFATDDDFELDKNTSELLSQGKKQGIALSVFYFDMIEDANEKKFFKGLVKKAGKGKYHFINKDKVEMQLLEEAQAVKGQP